MFWCYLLVFCYVDYLVFSVCFCCLVVYCYCEFGCCFVLVFTLVDVVC